MHLQPAQPGVTKPQRRHGPALSLAGQGPGLQVFPGSTPEVDCVSMSAAGYTVACHAAQPVLNQHAHGSRT
jgi:hypothetical protein